jgi:hypothetical protein
VDFFPIYLDIAGLLVSLPADKYTYTLSCEDAFLNYVGTDLKPAPTEQTDARAGDYLTKLDSTNGQLDAAAPLPTNWLSNYSMQGRRCRPIFSTRLRNMEKASSSSRLGRKLLIR